MFRFSYKNAVQPKIFIGDIGEIKLENNQLVKGSNRNIVIEFNTSWSKIEKLNQVILFKKISILPVKKFKQNLEFKSVIEVYFNL